MKSLKILLIGDVGINFLHSNNPNIYNCKVHKCYLMKRYKIKYKTYDLTLFFLRKNVGFIYEFLFKQIDLTIISLEKTHNIYLKIEEILFKYKNLRKKKILLKSLNKENDEEINKIVKLVNARKVLKSDFVNSEDFCATVIRNCEKTWFERILYCF